ncbi:MAG: NUDIX hydrolase [Anaerolineae bacterium]|nr:NUDIX hydrolase [Anaerolineae bacterium]
MRVREDKIERQDGSRGIYGYVEKKDFVIIVPIFEDRMILVEQYRYPVGGRHWEFPQGSWEDRPINTDDMARAELEEETGYLARDLQKIGHLFLAYGLTDQGYHIYVARNLSPTQKQLDPEEVGLISKTFDVNEVEEMILSGKIKDATTVAVFGLLRLKHLI